jgi:prostaglandin-H2 D-isomerase / glutathione transferase
MSFSLYYLPLRARAEPIRLTLAYGEVRYEDVTVSVQDWSTLKHDRAVAPFGQLPVIRLESGEVIAQSGAIIRLAAKLAGIYPENPVEAARADMIYEFAQELNMVNPILNFWPISSEQWQTSYTQFFEALPRHLTTCESLLGEKAFYGGNSPHYGDFAIFHIFDTCITVNPQCLNGYIKLQEFVDRIKAIPSIQRYLQNRLAPRSIGLCGSFMQVQVARIQHH